MMIHTQAQEEFVFADLPLLWPLCIVFVIGIVLALFLRK